MNMHVRLHSVRPLFYIYVVVTFGVVHILSLFRYYDTNAGQYNQISSSKTKIPYTFTMLPDLSKCENNRLPTMPTLVITILSIAHKYEQRKSIRESWGSRNFSNSAKNDRIAIFFVLSTPRYKEELFKVQSEQDVHHDIIMSDLDESYENLVTKVHVCLTFYIRHCANIPFLMKVDDDVSVDLDRLFDTWEKSDITTEKLFCQVLNNSEPIRDSSSKWSTPTAPFLPQKKSDGKCEVAREDTCPLRIFEFACKGKMVLWRYVPEGKWPLRVYPEYCNGPIYIMGNVAAKRILQQSIRLPLFIMEDVFYTGLIARSLAIEIVDWKDKIQNHIQYEQVEVPVCGPNFSAITVAHFPLSTPKEMMEGSLKLKRTTCFPFPWPRD